ncbi:glutaredoxin [Qipengyuania sp. 1NDW9]|uniref:Methylamine utilization protein MauE n=1 Tax=Qipengyuania xiapuensis TaxID=2867236 RepID=A0ABX8ZVM7_9SPHN|nr:glutaredoxin [Qipengyuania xiapuensis]MBX7493027.1 glutaredoxin [Qipengyuania xiapuensis]QZD92821.1 glutaredoxin [Qipengyuania xiapuensis]
MTKTAQLYRMVMDKHVCPYGIKAKWLLEKHGYTVEDHHLSTREQTDAFKEKHGVKTTPQVFIEGERIGGYDALREHFGTRTKAEGEKSYRPVLAVFAVGAALAISLSFFVYQAPFTIRAAEWFVAFSMAMLAMLKLQDVEQFSSMFVGYDLLGRRFVPYAYAYPYLEATAAVLMAGRILPWLSIPIALIIGTIGAVSVFYAVYIQKRDIKCACVGGSASVPLGFVSLTENLAMIGMAVWMLLRPTL